jgi:pimeloyl-ACP methyl ester carboxylesterase
MGEEGSRSHRDARGSAVLVHGGWGNPDDWRQVGRLLEDAGVHVRTPDLPSHRSATAGLADDAAEVRDAIRSCSPPVVVVGWSYGGTVISMAAAGEASVTRLIYVSASPMRPNDHPDDLSWVDQDPHIIARDDGTFILDNDWWLNEEAGTTFPHDVVEHLRRHPRRPVSRETAQPQTAAAWQTIPSTVLMGRDDQLVPQNERQWAINNLEDVRFLDSDHFIIFRAPDLVSSAVLEALPAS